MKFQFTSKILLSALILAGLGCSRVSVIDQFADTYLNWTLDDYLDLTSPQKKSFKTAVAEGLKDVRSETVPLLAEHFRITADQLEKKYPSDDLEAQTFVLAQKDFFEVNFKILLETVMPRFKSSFETLDWKNWEAFKVEFEKQNAKMLKRRDKCASRFEDRLEEWIGSTEKSQDNLIEIYCQLAPWDSELQIKNRNYLLSLFEKEMGLTANQFSGLKVWQGLLSWSEKMHAMELPEYKKMRENRKKELMLSLQKIILSLSSKQKKNLIENIRIRSAEMLRLAPR